jgi:hypothetical protein
MNASRLGLSALLLAFAASPACFCTPDNGSDMGMYCEPELPASDDNLALELAFVGERVQCRLGYFCRSQFVVDPFEEPDPDVDPSLEGGMMSHCVPSDVCPPGRLIVVSEAQMRDLDAVLARVESPEGQDPTCPLEALVVPQFGDLSGGLNLGSLRSISGDLIILGTAPELDLPNLESVGGSIRVESRVHEVNLPRLKSVGGSIALPASTERLIAPALEELGGSVLIGVDNTVEDHSIVVLNSSLRELHLGSVERDSSSLDLVTGRLQVEGNSALERIAVALMPLASRVSIRENSTPDTAPVGAPPGVAVDDAGTTAQRLVVELPRLVTVQGALALEENPRLGSLSTPLLFETGEVRILKNPALTVWDASSLKAVQQDFSVRETGLDTCAVQRAAMHAMAWGGLGSLSIEANLIGEDAWVGGLIWPSDIAELPGADISDYRCITGKLLFDDDAIGPVSLPGIETVGGGVELVESKFVTQLAMPDLDAAANFIVRKTGSLRNVSLPALRFVAGGFVIMDNTTTGELTIGAPALETVGATWVLYNNRGLSLRDDGDTLLVRNPLDRVGFGANPQLRSNLALTFGPDLIEWIDANMDDIEPLPPTDAGPQDGGGDGDAGSVDGGSLGDDVERAQRERMFVLLQSGDVPPILVARNRESDNCDLLELFVRMPFPNDAPHVCVQTTVNPGGGIEDNLCTLPARVGCGVSRSEVCTELDTRPQDSVPRCDPGSAGLDAGP